MRSREIYLERKEAKETMSWCPLAPGERERGGEKATVAEEEDAGSRQIQLVESFETAKILRTSRTKHRLDRKDKHGRLG